MEPLSKSRNYIVGESYAIVPESEYSPNRHLYTCQKKPQIEPLICTKASVGMDVSGHSDSYSYALKGVSDLTVKCDEDWVVRRQVSVG